MEFLLLTGTLYLRKKDSKGKSESTHFEVIKVMDDMEKIEEEILKKFSATNVHFKSITILTEKQALIMYPNHTKEFIEKAKRSGNSEEPTFVYIKE